MEKNTQVRPFYIFGLQTSTKHFQTEDKMKNKRHNIHITFLLFFSLPNTNFGLIELRNYCLNCFTVKNEHDVNMKLNEFLREVAGLRDTKVMCYEGGCGSCLVVASKFDHFTEKNKTYSINSVCTPL